MALMREEPSSSRVSSSSMASIPPPESGSVSALGSAGGVREKSSSKTRHQSNGSITDGTRSESSANTEKSISPSGSTPLPPPPGVTAPTLPTKRTVRELLETRNTPSKMEIGQGVILKADIVGAELVIIRGIFEGIIKAQCIDIEEGAEVRGTIECEAARVNGMFDGIFVSQHSLHLASHANVSGRVIYRRLKVAKGAQMYGYSEYRSPVMSK